MTPEISTLDNGMRIVSLHMPWVETVSLGVWVASGSRHETEKQHGLAHFLEHMAFKGTASRSAQQIAEEIEETGGELNASTGHDTTAYYARVLKEAAPKAIETLADIMLNSEFSEVEMEREREVILQEIAGAQDSADELAYDLQSAAAFPDQTLGRTILGTPKSVSSFRPADLRRYLDNNYSPEIMVVSAAGAIHHDDLVRHCEALFGSMTAVKLREEQPAAYVGGASSDLRAFEQSQLLIGLPSASYIDDDYIATQVFSGLFGGGMSSRLFQKVREQRGLCYAIDSAAWGLKDTGMFVVQAATGRSMVGELAQLVAEEFQAVIKDGPTEAEISRARAQMKAGVLMALESSAARTEQMARHLLTYDRLLPVAELVKKIDAVTVDNVRAVAARMVKRRATTTVVGSGRFSRKQSDRVAALFGELANQQFVVEGV